MRLLHVHTRQLEEYNGDFTPPYAILSHTWCNNEITFQHLSNPGHRSLKEYEKIAGCCQQAAQDGLSYVWIDTCCIDKSSSAELSEGINSMFQWYRKSTVCYIYLSDVSADDDPFLNPSEFRSSRWFTRGWTLQELLAPKDLIFFDKAWTEINVGRLSRSSSPFGADRNEGYINRLSLLGLLSDITHIPKKALATGDFSQFCAAARLAWAAKRKTTRVEDGAYSLLGLLEVNMPLLYGEGTKAFLRLQEEIVKSRHDDSLLAWGYRLAPQANPMFRSDSVLARSPADFTHCHSFEKLESKETSSEVPLTTSHSAMTNIGMQIAIPIRTIDLKNGVSVAILRCRVALDGLRSHLVVPLVQTHGGDKNHFSRAPGSPPFLIHRAKLISLINNSKFLFSLTRVPFLWKCFMCKAPPTPIYLRENPITTTPQLSWPRSKRGESKGINLHIDELRSAGYGVSSFYPPRISGKSASGNCLVLTWGSPNSARFMIVFSRPREFSTGYLFFAVFITLKSFTVARVHHGSSLEYLMERSRTLQVEMNRHGITQTELKLDEEAADGSVRCLHHISFQYLFGDIRIKCEVRRTYAETNNSETEDIKESSQSELGTFSSSKEEVPDHIPIG